MLARHANDDYIIEPRTLGTAAEFLELRTLGMAAEFLKFLLKIFPLPLAIAVEPVQDLINRRGKCQSLTTQKPKT